MDKKTELELKKAKLEQIRKERTQRAAGAVTGQSTTPVGPNNGQTDTTNVDPDKILIECGITTPVVTSNMSASSLTASSHSIGGSLSDSTNLQHHHVPGQSKALFKNKKQVKLSINTVNAIDIPPKENVTYSKETQTPATDVVLDKDAKPLDYYVLTFDNDDDETASLDASSSTGGVSTQTNHHHKSKSANNKQQNQHGSRNQDDKSLNDHLSSEELKSFDDKVKLFQSKELSDEERQRMLDSDDFLNFFMRNTRILEKALDQDDIFFEYGAKDKNTDMVETGQALKLNREFQDDRLRNRIVTWLDWSPHYPELLLASYEDSSLDPDGVALVWNSKFKTTAPEYTFNCSSWVTSCCFAKFHPNLIIAGTYSGQIVMWDNRSNKRTPIQRSSLSAASHTHPIHCIQVVGSQNAHNLISISNDGKLCSWTLDNMNTPQETLELQCKQTKHVAVTSMGFRSGDVNNFVLGSEEGQVYMATRHGNKSGINECFEGHYGPVTGLSCHQVQGQIDFSHIFLTSSFDWSVKLWNLKEPGKPLYSFEHNSDYVYDVQWSTINPALFATVDGTGRLDLWNLINDAEVPSASVLIDGAPALNKVRWNQSGNALAVGDDQGKISLFDVNEAYANPRADDWSRFVRVLQDLKQNSVEMDETVSGAGGPGGLGANVTPGSGSGLNTSNSMLANQLSPIVSSGLPSVKSEPAFDYKSAGLTSPQSYGNLIKQQQSPHTPK